MCALISYKTLLLSTLLLLFVSGSATSNTTFSVYCFHFIASWTHIYICTVITNVSRFKQRRSKGSGGSRISQRKERQPRRGAPTYYLANLSRKLQENEDFFGPEWGIPQIRHWKVLRHTLKFDNKIVKAILVNQSIIWIDIWRNASYFCTTVLYPALY